jgi:hypothetical protein
MFVVCTEVRCYAQASNLIQNGSFELPGGGSVVPAGSTYITDWVVGGNGDVAIADGRNPAGDYSPAQDGNFFLDLSGDEPTHATIYQDFTTTPGIQYSLTFYIGSSSHYTPAQQIINVQLLGTSVLLDTTLTPLAPSGHINWLEETFSFKPDSTTTRLSFVDKSGSDDNASYVDNVSVSEVPEPTTLALVLCGIGLFLSRLRKR